MSSAGIDLASLLVLGFLLGMRHATDADHVIAIATIVSRQRSLRGSALIGAAWGLGHTLTILVVGGAIILFDIVIPTRMGLRLPARPSTTPARSARPRVGAWLRDVERAASGVRTRRW